MRYSFTVHRRKGSPYWQGRIYLEGEGGADRRFSTGIEIGERWRESKREAEIVAGERAAALASSAQVAVAEASSNSISAVGERMLRQKRADKKRDRTVDALAGNLDKHVIPYFGEHREVGSIRRADLEGFKIMLAEKRYQPTTINNALTAIRQVLKHACHVEETIDHVPAVKNVEVDQQGKGRALTRVELAALLAAVEDREAREWLTFVANTGLRREESLSIRWSWIDWTARVIRVPAEYRKGGKKQIKPTQLNRTTLKLLRARQRRAEQPSDDRVWWQRKRRKYDQARNQAAEKIALGRVRTHDLRHTLGSLAHAGGAAATEVRDMLGHSTLAMVSRYGHSYDDRLQAITRSIEIVPGRVPGENSSRGGDRATSEKAKEAKARRKTKGSR